MYEIRTKYKGQGADVVGKEFTNYYDAQMELEVNGWRPDYAGGKGPGGERYWTKAGPTRMMGQIGICMSEYVYIAET